MKTLLKLSILGLIFSGAQALAFSDVPSSHTNHTAITWLEDQGVVQGYSDGNFHPGQVINRAEFLKMLFTVRKYQILDNHQSTVNFTDVPITSWYTPYVGYAQEHKTIEGYPDNTFRADQPINVVEAAKILVEDYKLPKYYEENAVWYAPTLGALSDANVIPTTITSLDQKLTRGEFAELLYRLENNKRDQDIHRYDSLSRTFIKPLKGIGPYLTTDDHYVYYQGVRIPDLDPKTTVPVKYPYLKDNTKVLYLDYKEGKWIYTKISEADPATFVKLGERSELGKDKAHIFYNELIVQTTDPIDLSSLEALDYNYFKDKNHVWYFDFLEYKPYLRLVKNADPKNFRELSSHYGKDDMHVYRGVTPIEEADAPSFTWLYEEYTLDRNTAYFTGKKIPGSDPESFEIYVWGAVTEWDNTLDIMWNGYAKDKNHFYKNGDRTTEAIFTKGVEESRARRESINPAGVEKVSFPNYGLTITSRSPQDTLREEDGVFDGTIYPGEPIVAYLIHPTLSIEENIREAMKKQGAPDPSKCVINGSVGTEGQITYSVDLDPSIAYTPEEKQQLSNIYAYPVEGPEQFFREQEIRTNKIASYCGSAIIHFQGTSKTGAPFFFHFPRKNSKYFFFQGLTSAPTFYSHIEAFEPETK